eukprot:403372588
MESKQVANRSQLHNFYQKIKSEKSEPIRKILEKYYRKQNLEKCENRDDQGQNLQNLMTLMEQKMQEVYNETDENEIIINAEGIEAIVTKNFYKQIFCPEEEQEINKKISENIQIHKQFLMPKHLDIDETRIIPEMMQNACHYLNLMNQNNKLPRGKLKNVTAYCNEISKMLVLSAKEGNPDGADTFFPMITFGMMQLPKETTDLLYSNIEYIRLFRHESRLEGKEQYHLTTVSSSVSFLMNLKAKDLDIDPSEYEELYQKALSIYSLSELSNINQQVDLLGLDEDSSKAQNTSNQAQINQGSDKDSQSPQNQNENDENQNLIDPQESNQIQQEDQNNSSSNLTDQNQQNSLLLDYQSQEIQNLKDTSLQQNEDLLDIDGQQLDQNQLNGNIRSDNKSLNQIQLLMDENQKLKKLMKQFVQSQESLSKKDFESLTIANLKSLHENTQKFVDLFRTQLS